MTRRIVCQLRVLLAQKSLTERRKITLQEVAIEADVAYSLVLSLDKNTVRAYPSDALVKLCTYLQCDVQDLLQIVDDPAVEPAPTSAPGNDKRASSRFAVTPTLA